MSYIIIQPHSNSNPTGKFLVARFDDVMAFLNGLRRSYPHSVHNTYGNAVDACGWANEQEQEHADVSSA